MAADLIVVAAHGPAHIGACVASLGDARRLVVDTGSGTVPGADVVLAGGHPTGAYLHAYRHHHADGYLFIQDSMTAVVDDVLTPFRDQMPHLGAVAWGLFGLAWDSPQQRQWVSDHYQGAPPARGIFGPVFYTSRASLDLLAARHLLPAVPANKIEAQGTERAWAWAFHNAGLAVIGPPWDKEAMERGFGPFRKVFAGRT